MGKSAQRRASNREYDARRRTHAWRKLYKDPRWVKGRKLHLARHPLCVMCEARGITRAANTVDHKVPHRGDEARFFDEANWQSLCSTCHDVHKQREEGRGFSTETDQDGWPVDPRHPANAHQRPRVPHRRAAKAPGGSKSLQLQPPGPAAPNSAQRREIQGRGAGIG